MAKQGFMGRFLCCFVERGMTACVAFESGSNLVVLTSNPFPLLCALNLTIKIQMTAISLIRHVYFAFCLWK